MANSLELKGQALDRYQSAGGDAGEEIADRLQHILDHPEPDGRLIIALDIPPAVIYVYDDGTYQVSYSLSRDPSTLDFHITVFAIIDPSDPRPWWGR